MIEEKPQPVTSKPMVSPSEVINPLAVQNPGPIGISPSNVQIIQSTEVLNKHFSSQVPFQSHHQSSSSIHLLQGRRTEKYLGKQRDFSTFSILSKDTNDNSLNQQSKSSIMGPQFKFGIHRRSMPHVKSP